MLMGIRALRSLRSRRGRRRGRGRHRAEGGRHGGAATIALVALACGSDATPPGPPQLAVLAAFPAELEALVERAEVSSTLDLGDGVLRVGTLGGVRVVLAMTGIGLVNAEMTTRAVLDRFEVRGVILSGVAGSPFRIGDVTVPDEWRLVDGSRFPVDAAWRALARRIGARPAGLERCTVVPDRGEEVCLGHEPEVVFGGIGESDDPFGGSPLPCRPDGDDVFGCDFSRGEVAASVPDGGVVTVDMETAAVAREAAARGLPFVGFRGVSDGEGDPLGLPGFPAQFFAYYRLAANNAAAATTEFIRLLGSARPPIA